VTDTHGVPEYWLASFGLTGNFESNAEGDADSDGMATWKEWYTDTDPTNALSLLKFTDLVWSNGMPTLTWIGGVTRTQLVQRTTTPSGTWQTLLTNLPPTSLTNTVTLQQPSGTSVFYRISVP